MSDGRDADAGRTYTPEPKVQAQIEKLSGMSLSRQLSTMRADGSVTERIGEESLVHFARLYHASGDSRSASEVARVLAGRVSRKIARLATLWRLHVPPDLLDDIADEVLTELYDAVFKTEASSDFWEVRFWVCFNRRVLNILRHRRFELDQLAADDLGDADFDETQLPAQVGSTNRFTPVEHALITDALAGLPLPWRTAFILKHWSGYNEESSMDGSPTIATLMEVSGRTVRNYLTKAEAALEDWRLVEGEQLDA